MSPRLICNNHPDISIGSAKFPRESCAGIYSRHVQLPNPANYISIKFRMICLLAFRLPAFLVFVTAIVASRTNKKMFRINAGWVVAFMKNTEAFWNFTIVNKPRNPVCLICLPLHVKSSITSSKSIARPQPATVGFFDAFPEIVNCISFLRHMVSYASC